MKTQSNDKLIPLPLTNLLRIVFEIMVLIHHLYVPTTKFGDAVNSILGPAAVAGFFLLSGYGVAINYKEKGQEYLNKLFKKRIPTTYLCIVLVCFAYLTLYYITGKEFTSFVGMLSSLLYLPVFKGYVALSHWLYFLADLLLYYIFFFFIMQAFKNKEKCLEKTAWVMLILLGLTVVVLTVINAKTGSYRYLRGCWLFPLGIIFTCCEKDIVQIIKKFKLPLISILAGLTLILGGWAWKVYPVREYVLCAVVALLVLTLFQSFNKQSKVIGFLSAQVMLVYLSHEYVFKLLRFLTRNSKWHFMAILAVTVAVSLAFSIGCNYIYKKVSSKVKKALA